MNIFLESNLGYHLSSIFTTQQKGLLYLFSKEWSPNSWELQKVFLNQHILSIFIAPYIHCISWNWLPGDNILRLPVLPMVKEERSLKLIFLDEGTDHLISIVLERLWQGNLHWFWGEWQFSFHRHLWIFFSLKLTSWSFAHVYLLPWHYFSWLIQGWLQVQVEYVQEFLQMWVFSVRFSLWFY